MATVLQEMVAAGYPVTTDRSKGDGDSTCLWHRQSEWIAAHGPRPVACSICNGDILDTTAQGAAHELCRARQRRGVATPRMDQTRRCPCQRCAREAR